MIAKRPLDNVEAVDVDYDVVVVGAGLSGINTAYRLQTGCPEKSYCIIEARDSLGGTWDFFKYPGLRSDSDLHTFGFPWKPWPSKTSIADGPSILAYMNECAAEFGIDKKIKYRHELDAANWSSHSAAWTLSVDHAGSKKTMTARWIVFATGYYDYKTPLQTKINGIEHFQGQIVHPQFWPAELDYAGKDIAVIGSGATAVTLIPNLTDKASHVTMVQRSPSYVLSQPRDDPTSTFLRWILPSSWASQLIRIKWLLLPFLFFKFCRAFPHLGRRIVQRLAQRQLPVDVPIKPHFDPSYGPWEQRLCVCPSGDFFTVLREHKASIVTGHIDKVTADSIYIKGNDIVLKPDIIVTATGLKVMMAGGAKVSVDGEPVHLPDRHVWRGALLEGIPNMCLLIGYTNASWTLGAEATAQMLQRILHSMDSQKQLVCNPTIEGELQDRPLLNLSSTYLVKAVGEMPKAGDRGPWLARQNYLVDVWTSWYGSITDGLHYS